MVDFCILPTKLISRMTSRSHATIMCVCDSVRVCVQAYASVHVFMSACVCVCVYVITLLLPYDINSSMKKCLALVGNSMLFTEFLNPWLYSTVAASRHGREETTIEGGMLQDNYMHHTGI